MLVQLLTYLSQNIEIVSFVTLGKLSHTVLKVMIAGPLWIPAVTLWAQSVYREFCFFHFTLVFDRLVSKRRPPATSLCVYTLLADNRCVFTFDLNPPKLLLSIALRASLSAVVESFKARNT